MLVLASASPRRLELLRRIGYEPDLVYSPEADETPLPKEQPKQLVRRLAHLKAQAAAERFYEAIVIAADTIPYFRGKYLNKPATHEEAASHLRLLSGRRHKVYTGLCVIAHGKVSLRVCVTTLKFKRLTEEEIAWHTESGDWDGKSGGYSLQGRAGVFVEWIHGSDSNVLGLPLYETYCLLQGAGLHHGIGVA